MFEWRFKSNPVATRFEYVSYLTDVLYNVVISVEPVCTKKKKKHVQRILWNMFHAFHCLP